MVELLEEFLSGDFDIHRGLSWFFFKKLAPSFNFHSAGLTKLTAFHKCWWFK